MQSNELDLLADSGLGDGSKILACESGPVESLEISKARVPYTSVGQTQSKKILCSGLPRG